MRRFGPTSENLRCLLAVVALVGIAVPAHAARSIATVTNTSSVRLDGARIAGVRTSGPIHG